MDDLVKRINNLKSVFTETSKEKDNGTQTPKPQKKLESKKQHKVKQRELRIELNQKISDLYDALKERQNPFKNQFRSSRYNPRVKLNKNHCFLFQSTIQGLGLNSITLALDYEGTKKHHEKIENSLEKNHYPRLISSWPPSRSPRDMQLEIILDEKNAQENKQDIFIIERYYCYTKNTYDSQGTSSSQTGLFKIESNDQKEKTTYTKDDIINWYEYALALHLHNAEIKTNVNILGYNFEKFW